MVTVRTTSAGAMPVSPDNFVRAESDLYFGNIVKDGGFGKFKHIRELAPDGQAVRHSVESRHAVFGGRLRPRRGTGHGVAPRPHDRSMSMQVITEDHFVPDVFYGQGDHTLTRAEIGTRYVMVAVRILVDPNDEADTETSPCVARCRRG